MGSVAMTFLPSKQYLLLSSIWNTILSSLKFNIQEAADTHARHAPDVGDTFGRDRDKRADTQPQGAELALDLRHGLHLLNRVARPGDLHRPRICAGSGR